MPWARGQGDQAEGGRRPSGRKGTARTRNSPDGRGVTAPARGPARRPRWARQPGARCSCCSCCSGRWGRSGRGPRSCRPERVSAVGRGGRGARVCGEPSPRQPRPNLRGGPGRGAPSLVPPEAPALRIARSAPPSSTPRGSRGPSSAAGSWRVSGWRPSCFPSPARTRPPRPSMCPRGGAPCGGGGGACGRTLGSESRTGAGRPLLPSQTP